MAACLTLPLVVVACACHQRAYAACGWVVPSERAQQVCERSRSQAIILGLLRDCVSLTDTVPPLYRGSLRYTAALFVIPRLSSATYTRRCLQVYATGNRVWALRRSPSEWVVESSDRCNGYWKFFCRRQLLYVLSPDSRITTLLKPNTMNCIVD